MADRGLVQGAAVCILIIAVAPLESLAEPSHALSYSRYLRSAITQASLWTGAPVSLAE